MILKVRHYGDPVLRLKALPVDRIDEEIKQIAEDLIDTLIDEQGLGLAAPQVGISKRMIALDAKEVRGQPFVVLNPEILESSGKEVREEGCLSFPGIYGKIERPFEATIKCLDMEGKELILKVKAMECRAFMHEIDHLNGKLFIDRMSKTHKLVVQGAIKKLMHQTKEELAS